MMIDPFSWKEIPIIKVADKEVLSILNKNTEHVAFVSFFGNANNYLLTPYVESAYSKRPIDRTKFDKKIIEIDERVNICSMIFLAILSLRSFFNSI